MVSHCLTRLISSAPIASMSLGAASYSATMASADSLPISVAPCSCGTYSGIVGLGTPAVTGALLAGGSSRSDAVFGASALTPPSRAIPLSRSSAVDLSITDYSLVLSQSGYRGRRGFVQTSVCRRRWRNLSAINPWHQLYCVRLADVALMTRPKEGTATLMGTTSVVTICEVPSTKGLMSL